MVETVSVTLAGLPAPSVLLAFLLASLILALSPGPGVAYILMRSLSQGQRAGAVASAGLALGNLGNAMAAALGLAALLAVSTTAFAVLKWAGVMYLLYLAWRAWHAPQMTLRQHDKRAFRGYLRVFFEACLVGLLNPKTALFFAAFLPQFAVGSAPLGMQIAVLGSLFVVVALLTDLVYALAAGAVAPRLRQATNAHGLLRYAQVATYLALALLAAAASPRLEQQP